MCIEPHALIEHIVGMSKMNDISLRYRRSKYVKQSNRVVLFVLLIHHSLNTIRDAAASVYAFVRSRHIECICTSTKCLQAVANGISTLDEKSENHTNTSQEGSTPRISYHEISFPFIRTALHPALHSPIASLVLLI